MVRKVSRTPARTQTTLPAAPLHFPWAALSCLKSPYCLLNLTRQSFCYQRNTAAVSVVLITPVTPHLGEAGGQASPLVAAAGGTRQLKGKRLEESLACTHVSDSPAFNAVNILAAAAPGSN